MGFRTLLANIIFRCFALRTSSGSLTWVWMSLKHGHMLMALIIGDIHAWPLLSNIKNLVELVVFGKCVL